VLEDEVLARAARAGDRAAFGKLIERHRPGIYRLCYRLTGSAADAEDLAHDTFVEAFLKLGQLRQPDRFLAWLRTTALNLGRGRHRQLRDEARRLSGPAAAAESENPCRIRLGRALPELSPAHRLALALHYSEGLSYEEIARFLEVPVGTVMSRMNRARRDLKRRAGQSPVEEEPTMLPDETFDREVQAEIGLLLSLFRDDRQAMDRLSVLLRRSPGRLVELLERGDPEVSLADLALVLRRVGTAGLETVLTCALSPEAVASPRAAAVLAHFIRGGRSLLPGLRSARTATREAYLALDALFAAQPAPVAAAGLLLGVLAAPLDEQTAPLVTSALLCYPAAAYPRLLDQFWSGTRGDVLYALGRTGDRFAATLIDTLRAGDPRRRARALEGAEAIARGLRCDAPGDAPDEDRMALEARFRRKWAPPLSRDRDPVVLAALAEAIGQRLEEMTAGEQVRAVSVLGWLRSRPHQPAVEALARDGTGPVRLAAIRALAELGAADAAGLLADLAERGTSAERAAALDALGRLQVDAARALAARATTDPDPLVCRAGTFALGSLDGDASALLALSRGPAAPNREAARRALHARRQQQTAGAAAPPRRLHPRVGFHTPNPPYHVSVEAAIRHLPEDRSYSEADLTRRIAELCADYSSTRRYLVEGGLMQRERGIYRLTPLGAAVWRVERCLRVQYLAGPR
jgi:RNA polymerase sigma-70 factor (ECF subfamily)